MKRFGVWYNENWFLDALIDPEYNQFMDFKQKVGKYSTGILDLDEYRPQACYNFINKIRPIKKARQVLKRGLVQYRYMKKDIEIDNI